MSPFVANSTYVSVPFHCSRHAAAAEDHVLPGVVLMIGAIQSCAPHQVTSGRSAKNFATMHYVAKFDLDKELLWTNAVDIMPKHPEYAV